MLHMIGTSDERKCSRFIGDQMITYPWNYALQAENLEVIQSTLSIAVIELVLLEICTRKWVNIVGEEESHPESK